MTAAKSDLNDENGLGLQNASRDSSRLKEMPEWRNVE